MFCSACVSGKCHQLPLELIYSDVWGSASVLASNRAQYYVSFVDAYTKFTWIYLIHHKSQVKNVLNFLKFLLKIKLDIRFMLYNLTMKKKISLTFYLQACGIQHCLSCPYTHDKNRFVERKHPHIVDMGSPCSPQPFFRLSFGLKPSLLLFIPSMFFL